MFGSVSVSRPWAIILCRFKGSQPDPVLEGPIEQFYRDAFTPGFEALVEYWRDSSLGALDISSSRVFDWVEVDIPRDQAAVGRAGLANAAIRAVQQSAGSHALDGFFGQIGVYTHNWTTDDSNRPPGTPTWESDDPLKPWWPTWIDGGSTGGMPSVTLTPPHDGNISAHEMGHVFGMNHDVGADLTTDYQDPCCIMSQNGPFLHPTLQRNFGPAVCYPHLAQRNWMYGGREYYDSGDWQSHPEGITVPLAPLSRPGARANLGIRLAYTQNAMSWDYYLEYVVPAEWNRGVPGAPYLFIRRMAPKYGGTPAYLGALHIPAEVGAVAEFVEPSGNVNFSVKLTSLPGPILSVTARKL